MGDESTIDVRPLIASGFSEDVDCWVNDIVEHIRSHPMGDIIKMRPKGSSIDTLYQAAEEVMQDDTLRAIVVLYTDDPTEMTCMYSEDVDPVSAFYVLNRSAQWQLGLDDE